MVEQLSILELWDTVIGRLKQLFLQEVFYQLREEERRDFYKPPLKALVTITLAFKNELQVLQNLSFQKVQISSYKKTTVYRRFMPGQVVL